MTTQPRLLAKIVFARFFLLSCFFTPDFATEKSQNAPARPKQKRTARASAPSHCNKRHRAKLVRAGLHKTPALGPGLKFSIRLPKLSADHQAVYALAIPNGQN